MTDFCAGDLSLRFFVPPALQYRQARIFGKIGIGFGALAKVEGRSAIGGNPAHVNAGKTEAHAFFFVTVLRIHLLATIAHS